VAGKRYRFDAVESLRRAQRWRAELAVCRARESMERASAELATAQQALLAHRRSVPLSPADSTFTSVLELQASALYERRHAETSELLCGRLAQRKHALAISSAALKMAQAALEHTLAKVRVVERDRLRVQRARLRERDACDQAELEEQCAIERGVRSMISRFSVRGRFR
jgi:hypothetical protein